MAPRKQQLPAIYKFRVISECEVPELGPMLVKMEQAGLKVVGHELVTDTLAFAGNKKHDVKAEDFLGEWTMEHPTFPIKEAVAHFRANSRSPASCYTAAKVLVEKGLLKKLAGSNYARTDVKALAHAKPGGHESSGTDDIRRFIRGWKHFSTAQLKDLFREHGRNPHSVSPILDKLAKQKLIKRTGPSGSGEYMPLAKAKKIAPKKAPKALNGAQPVIEANANG